MRLLAGASVSGDHALLAPGIERGAPAPPDLAESEGAVAVPDAFGDKSPRRRRPTGVGPSQAAAADGFSGSLAVNIEGRS
jgi:hypothetical protein